MEVHHPHHVGHKKAIKEYLLEFFMLFFAVTLGFFTENIREHYVINDKKAQNLASLIEDLRQDSVSIHKVYESTTSGIQFLRRLRSNLYSYHDHMINENDLVSRVKDDLFNQYHYYTFYMDGSTYKNMVSAGLIGYIESSELKKKLTYYYETLSKRVDDNNKLVDQTAENFYGKYYPFVVASVEGDSSLIVGNRKIGPGQYMDFYLKQDIVKQKLISPELIIQTDMIYMRSNDYIGILELCKELNSFLLYNLSHEK